MNQKWRIALIICLVIMVCLTIVSAIVPTSKINFPRFSDTHLNSVNIIPDTFQNNKTIQNFFDVKTTNSFGGIQKPVFTVNLLSITMPRTSRPSFIFPQMTNVDSGVYITKEKAIEIASILFPGICLLDPIGADLRLINAPAYPLATNPCWVVDIGGYDPEGDACCHDCIIEGNVLSAYVPYGGHIIIDAITGEILYVDYLN